MKVTFFSNYMNHHQEKLSLKLYELTNGDYNFVACEPIDQERLDMGYEDSNKKYDFIVRPYEDESQKKLAEKLALESDFIIFGSGDEQYLKLRTSAKNKIIFRYTERLLKKGVYRRFIPITYGKIKRAFLNYKDLPMYVLCSSAYTSYDLSLCGFSAEKCFKWGYFPENKEYDVEKSFENKKKNEIIWVGRLIDWKHPEYAVLLAEKLKKNDFDFHITIIGTGYMEERIKYMIEKKKLKKHISFLGSMSPGKVREYMEKSDIFIATSNFEEGWGAVLNEAMNSGCGCVASHSIGSAPFLIKDKENGIFFENENLNDLYNKVEYLLKNPEQTKKLGLNAYKTINENWNAEIAAERLIRLYEKLSKGDETEFKEGLCSKSEVLKNRWYKSGKGLDKCNCADI